jgi:hypothetical protein
MLFCISGKLNIMDIPSMSSFVSVVFNVGLILFGYDPKRKKERFNKP